MPSAMLLSAFHNISLNLFFCAGVRLLGNLTLTSTIISPRSAGFLLFGMPRCGKVSLKPGPVGPPLETGTFLPSIVEMVRFQPVSASLRSSSMVWRRLSSSRTKRGCGFYISEPLAWCLVDEYGVKSVGRTSLIIKCISCTPPSS